MATSKMASVLQKRFPMKSAIVAFLAALTLSACGLEEGEYWDGEKLVSATGEALEEGAGCDVAQPPGLTPTLTGGEGPGVVSLPQDPIPVMPPGILKLLLLPHG